MCQTPERKAEKAIAQKLCKCRFSLSHKDLRAFTQPRQGSFPRLYGTSLWKSTGQSRQPLVRKGKNTAAQKTGKTTLLPANSPWGKTRVYPRLRRISLWIAYGRMRQAPERKAEKTIAQKLCKRRFGLSHKACQAFTRLENMSFPRLYGTSLWESSGQSLQPLVRKGKNAVA